MTRFLALGFDHLLLLIFLVLLWDDIIQAWFWGSIINILGICDNREETE